MQLLPVFSDLDTPGGQECLLFHVVNVKKKICLYLVVVCFHLHKKKKNLDSNSELLSLCSRFFL